MITLQRNHQKMKYALLGESHSVYQRDRNGEIAYYVDENGNVIYLDTGDKETNYEDAVPFEANISNKLDEVIVKEFGIDDSTNYAQIVSAKNFLPLKEGSVIWKKSSVKTKINANNEVVVDEKSADYIVKGVADEGLNVDLFLLQKNV